MKKVYSVGQVNRYVKNMFVQDFFLQKLCVSGEVSNCKYHTSGHIYFSLKDKTGVLSCVMFAGHRRGLSFRMKDGDQVLVDGTIDVYERDGRYQLYAHVINLAGAGDLYERYLLLKQELEERGMFDPAYKQPIPRYVKRLGVVTAPTGAAIQDIRNISYRRNPYLQIILYPALVQGEEAPRSIIKGIQMLEGKVDVIIVGRGGGSIEDLWAFNNEEVAYAIFNCSTPIISAVGHETDTTIADWVADLRAPTPSAAAELAVGDYRSLVDTVRSYRDRFGTAMLLKSQYYKSRLSAMELKLRYQSPQSRIRDARLRCEDLSQSLTGSMENIINEKRHSLALYARTLDGLSPLKKLSQGYAYVSGPSGHAVSTIKEVSQGDSLTITLLDGQITAVARESKAVDYTRYTKEEV